MKDDPERARARAREWYQANREHVREYRRKHYLANKERTDAKNRAWAAANPDKVREAGRRHKLKRKGVTLEWYDETLINQGGGCAICGGPPNGNKEFYDVDHDHKTNKARGLLCGGCNRGLGQFGDDRALLMAAADYLNPFMRRHG